MNNLKTILDNFLTQAQSGGLKTAHYPKEYKDLKMRVSFGMGTPAHVPWIAFTVPGMKVSRGFYPVYLYYKDLDVLILSYGVSETSEFDDSWPIEILNSTQTIKSYFDQDVPRYGDSFVFKVYSIKIEDDQVMYKSHKNENSITDIDLEADIDTMFKYYSKVTEHEIAQENSIVNQGLFYMEKQLEDFIIYNWDKTELGKKYDLIVEEGVLVSQQYRTDIGRMDILAKDKKTGGYVVIELKKNQTSDDTVGQVARYMGWIRENMKDDSVKGIIIASDFDKKLEYAIKTVPNVEVFLYKVSFTLEEFK